MVILTEGPSVVGTKLYYTEGPNMSLDLQYNTVGFGCLVKST